MSKARELANLGNAYSDGALSNRNLIINGAMQVAQRGTSVTGVGSTAYCICDRWEYREASGVSAVSDHEQSTDAPTGFKYSYKITCTTADAVAGSENAALSYKLEGYDTQHLSYGTSDAKQITLSFWVKSNVTGVYGVQFYNGTNYSALKPYTINSSATWEYKTITLDGDTTNATPDGNVQGLSVVFHIATGADDITSEYDWTAQASFRSVTGQANVFASASNYFQITGVQLEVGDTATPFEHRSYGQELALCQRYFWKQTSTNANGSYYRYANALFTSASTAAGVVRLPVEMRATPTLTSSGTISAWYGPAAYVGSVSLGTDGCNNSSIVLDVTGLSGRTAGVACMIMSHVNKTSYITYDAEL